MLLQLNKRVKSHPNAENAPKNPAISLGRGEELSNAIEKPTLNLFETGSVEGIKWTHYRNDR